MCSKWDFFWYCRETACLRFIADLSILTGRYSFDTYYVNILFFLDNSDGMIRITSNLHKNENIVVAMAHDHHGNNQCFIDIKLNRSGIIIMHNIQKERKYFISYNTLNVYTDI